MLWSKWFGFCGSNVADHRGMEYMNSASHSFVNIYFKFEFSVLFGGPGGIMEA